jgi:hypothetical protein
VQGVGHCRVQAGALLLQAQACQGRVRRDFLQGMLSPFPLVRPPDYPQGYAPAPRRIDRDVMRLAHRVRVLGFNLIR